MSSPDGEFSEGRGGGGERWEIAFAIRRFHPIFAQRRLIAVPENKEFPRKTEEIPSRPKKAEIWGTMEELTTRRANTTLTIHQSFTA